MTTVWHAIFPYFAALLPTVAVGTMFYFLIKNILEGDRNERLAQSKWEAEQDARAKTPPIPPSRPLSRGHDES